MDFIARQLQLEEEALQEGAQEYLRKVAQAAQSGRATSMGAAREALERTSARLAQGLDAELSAEDQSILSATHDIAQGITLAVDEESHKRGRSPVAIGLIKEAGSALCASVTVRAVLDGVGQEQASQRFVAKQIADLLEDERILRAFRQHLATQGTEQKPGEDASKFWEFVVRRAKQHTRHEARMHSLHQAMKYSGFDPDAHRFPPAHALTLGMTLIAIGERYGGLWETKTEMRSVRGKMQALLLLKLTDVAQRALDQRNHKLSLMHPLLLPMVAPPAPWGPNQRGGYLGVLSSRHPLVRRATKGDRQQLEAQEIPHAYDALNALQSTAFEVNQPVLEIAEWAWHTRHGGMAGMPSLNDPPRPARPGWADDETDPKSLEEPQLQEWREWKRTVAAWHDRCRKLISQRIATRQTLQTARRFAGEGSIYFPWNMDFRGRSYPIPTSLTPQGPDLHRGLLRFGRQTPVDSRALFWMAVHGANCLEVTHDGRKLTKMTFEERAQYIISITEQIRSVAQDPKADLWWAQAEEPWQFLAFCLEWERVCSLITQGKAAYSGLPVALDGTCNGLQHYAALLRDEAAAAAVNVSPTERPNDIYAAVAQAAERVLTGMTEGRDAEQADLAQRALSAGLASRKVCKRPTMTLPYGSGEYGFRAQIEETIRTDLPETIGIYLSYARPGDRLFPTTVLLSGVISQALAFTVRSAVECMSWFQKWASIASSQGKHFEWTVPYTGFTVRQRYVEEDESILQYTVLGERFRLAIRNPTQEVDSYRSRNASAPNLIHSFDAAAMHLTVTAAHSRGVRSFSMIHDSYATTPGEMETLWSTIRETFASFYADDLIAQLESEWIARYQPDPKDIPTRPTMGDLDPKDIAKSLYLFC